MAMKNLRILVLALGIIIMLPSCRLWQSVFKPKYGCPGNGKNIGAEKLVSGDPKAEKQARKAKKFRS
jgi:hypothetical protein